jgi:ABC-type multidrug transport system fused ATPase/permease subunit
MFTVLACAVGLGYFALGWSATTLAFVGSLSRYLFQIAFSFIGSHITKSPFPLPVSPFFSFPAEVECVEHCQPWAAYTDNPGLRQHITAVYRQEYFENIISKTVAFFDEERHSVGGLTAVVASDPTQLQQLLGTNMGFALISVLNVVGCLTISFYFGWKLTLVALSSSLPIVFAAGLFRIRYETRMEAMNKAVFAESAKFATESIGACRTVAALTLENSITARYEELLRNHVKEAFRKARFSTLVFAGSDSMPLLCMAFVLW